MNELERFRLAVEVSGHGIYITDAAGVIQYVNPAFIKITGYEASEVVGRTPAFLKSGRQDPDYYKKMWSVLGSGRVWKEEIVNRAKSGTLYNADQTISPIKAEDGSIEGFVAVQSDITSRKQLERYYRESEARYRTVVTAMTEGVLVRDAQGRIIAMNPSAERILGSRLADILGQTVIHSPFKTIHQDGSPFLDEDHPAVLSLKTGRAIEGVLMGLERPDGTTTWISVNSNPIVDSEGEAPTAVVTTFSDISDRIRYERELEQRSYSDVLTGLMNRRRGYQILEEEFARVERTCRSLTILMFDIDHFKRVNDTYGHETGDAVLKEVSKTAMSLVRETDSVIRWGGEEFLVIAPETDGEAGVTLAERLRAGIAALKVGYCEDESISVTASLGVSCFSGKESLAGCPPVTEDGARSRKDQRDQLIAQVIKRADEALYAAKGAGRNRVKRL